MRLKYSVSMELKNRIIVFLIITQLSSYGQQGLPSISKNDFNTFESIVLSSVKYFGDSIGKKRNYFFIMVHISEFDTASIKIKIALDYCYYNPLYLFNPTHVDTINGIIYAIRFGKKIDKALIRRFSFSPITSKEIAGFKKTGKSYSELNHKPTYSSQSFVFLLDDKGMNSIWYPNDTSAPIENKVLDSEYLKSGVKYETFLKKKLIEYGYSNKS